MKFTNIITNIYNFFNSPFQNGVYNMKTTVTPTFQVPSGLYQMTMDFKNAQGHIGCIQVQANV